MKQEFRFTKVTVFLGLMFTFFAVPALAATFHIATQSDFDSHNNDTYDEGDSILFKRGAVFNGKFTASGKGSSGNPIVLSTYDTGARPIINGGGVTDGALDLINVSFFEADGLELTNTDGSSDDQGWLIGLYVTAGNSAEHIHIKDFYIHDVNGEIDCPEDDLKACKGRGGMFIEGGVIDDFLIQGNTISNVGGTGIENNGDGRWKNVHVLDNFVNHTGRNSIIGRHSVDAVYEYNIAANSSRRSTGHSIFNFNTDGFIMQFNEAYGNTGHRDEIDRGGYDADYNATGTIIQYNYSHDNNWFCGIMKKGENDGIKIRYNISQNEYEKLYHYGFNSETAAKNIEIYNNTHYTKPGITHTLSRSRNPINTDFQNNIFYFEDEATWGTSFDDRENVTFNNNWYYGVEPPPEEANAHTGDPMLVNPGNGLTNIDMRSPVSLAGYMLQAGSPARGAGVPIENNGGRDFWGNPLKAGSTDIGASQWVPEPEYDTPTSAIVLGSARSGDLVDLVWGDGFTVTTGYAVQFSESIDSGFQTFAVVSAGTRVYEDAVNCRVVSCFYRVNAVNTDNGRSSVWSNVTEAVDGVSSGAVTPPGKGMQVEVLKSGNDLLIQVNSPQPGHVSGNIYSLRGRLIASLFNRQFFAGIREIDWNGWESLSRGMYQLRVRSGNEDVNQRLIKY